MQVFEPVVEQGTVDLVERVATHLHDEVGRYAHSEDPRDQALTNGGREQESLRDLKHAGALGTVVRNDSHISPLSSSFERQVCSCELDGLTSAVFSPNRNGECERYDLVVEYRRREFISQRIDRRPPRKPLKKRSGLCEGPVAVTRLPLLEITSLPLRFPI